MTRKTKNHGPTTKTVASNVRRLREKQGLSVPKLSAQTEKLGYEIPVEAIRKIEAAADGRPGARHVNADELVVLALALGVNPNALLLPESLKKSELVDVTGAHRRLYAEEAWEWARGEEPLAVRGQGYKPGTFRETVNPPWVVAEMDADVDRQRFFDDWGAAATAEINKEREETPPDGTDT